MKLFRQQDAFRILVIATMMACLASAVLGLVRRLVPGFEPTPLIVLAFLVCLEGIATDRLARQLPEASGALRLHLVEWVVILILLRLVISLSRGPYALAGDVARWLDGPENLFDGALFSGAVLLFTVWSLGGAMSRAVEALDPEADEPPPRESAAFYAWLTRPRAEQRTQGWQKLGNLFLLGGALVLVADGLARLDVQLALSLRHPAVAGIVGNALLYFALGLILLAQGHYAMLRAHWKEYAVDVAGPLDRRWVTLGLAFTAVVALLVLLLPTRPSLALFSAVYDAIAVVLYIVTGVVLAGFAALAYLFGLLASLLGFTARPQPEEPMPIVLPTPMPEQAAQQVTWWEAIQGFVLWAVVLAVVLYALVRFVRERRGLWQELVAGRGPLAWLARLLGAFWRWLARTGEEVGARWRSLLARPRAGGGPEQARERRLWFRPRNPREQVRLLYLLGLQRTTQLGWPRQAADTPNEYAERLEPHLPDGSQDLQALTQGFVEAKYSRREFTSVEVSPLRAALRRLRQLVTHQAGKAGEEEPQQNR